MSDVLYKHLKHYLLTAQREQHILAKLDLLPHFNEASLNTFTHQAASLNQLITQYQGWIALLIDKYGLTEESNQLIHQIETTFQQNLRLLQSLQTKITLYKAELESLIASAKPTTRTQPTYRFNTPNHYLDLHL
ncbi:hypothetical protein [Entomospira culicis]|uniref:FlgN protein n=1 Tax=Entomospira culicis TaxID=2719989 RepID=A0A968KVJ0_9SPIO|nr:hypothetical protein [Entomospira culicis]NIZ18958.1 hypothetical protein [Entomospira culicis]NIZ69173.1 hypothetical protein [Entomospira culicis]WDI37760.1 hypothetical protein PVA46_02960 [Entomospira culicis]WDI39388.1 hypothetical protein PVA47_02965 [Entomospira culicis]